jgi:hypothetical protein
MSVLDRLSARDRRALQLGLLVLAPALLWMAVIKPYRAALEDLRTRTAVERGLLAREQALLALAPSLPDSLVSAAAEANRADLKLVRAANMPLAEAELTKYLEGVAEHSRVLLEEMRGVAAEDSLLPAGRPLRLAVNGESDLQGVLTFLHRIEQGPLLVRVLELSLERVPEQQQQQRTGEGRGSQRGRRGGAPPGPRNVGAIQFNVVIEAYAPPEATVESSAPPSRESLP